MAPRRQLAALLVLALALSACASDPTQPATASADESPTAEPSAPAATAGQPSPSDATTTCDAPIRVALVTDVGGIDDNGYSQATYEGMTAAATAARSSSASIRARTSTASIRKTSAASRFASSACGPARRAASPRCWATPTVQCAGRMRSWSV